MKIITLLNEKGGVGKTTLATHIAAGLAIRGYRVVLVDTDAQANATSSLGIEPQPGLYRLLIQDAELVDVLRPVRPDVIGYDVAGELWIVPGNIETRAIPMVNPNPFILRDRFQELTGFADYVIIDTSPTPSVIHGAVYIATDGLIFPTNCSYFSLSGLAQSILHKEGGDAVRQAQALSSVKVMGIVPTMYRSVEAHDVGLQQLIEEYKRLVWPAIPLRTVWEKAAWAGETIFRFDPESEACSHAWALVERVLKHQPEHANE